MAAEPNITIGASDRFALHANFVEQSSSLTTTRDYATVLKANGDMSCKVAFNNRTEATNEYGYCGTDIITDLGTFFSSFWTAGDLFAIDSVTLTFSSTDYPRLSVSGHQHTGNTHVAAATGAKFDLSGLIAASQSGVGIPTLGTNYELTLTAATTAVTDLTLTITPAHIDVLGADGEHFAGVNTGLLVALSASGVGPSSDVTADLGSLWNLIDAVDSDSTSEFDTWAITAEENVDRIV